MECRLAAILAADVVGYWRLVRADKESMLERVKFARTDLIDPKISVRHGRFVKLMAEIAPTVRYSRARL